MTTIEKLAERVLEQGGIVTLSCEVCACKPRNSERCTQHSCPQEQAPDGALMLVRWAVKLVAEGLTPQIDEWERHIKGAQDGLTESDLLMNVAYKLLDLITEVEASAGEKSLKEGDANG